MILSIRKDSTDFLVITHRLNLISLFDFKSTNNLKLIYLLTHP